MVKDEYIQRMVEAFEQGGEPDRGLEIPPPESALDRALETWFLELDVAWVFQICQDHGSQWQLPLQDNSWLSLPDMVERWTRGLTVIVHGIVELRSMQCKVTADKRFGEASILKMLVFVDAIVPAFKAENLWTVLDMYKCVYRAVTTLEIVGILALYGPDYK
jgi:hypothetical protein